MKTTMKGKFTPTKMVHVKKLTTANTGERNLSYIASDNVKQYTHFWNQCKSFL